MPTARNPIVLFATAALLIACASRPDTPDQPKAKAEQPHEYLDEKSGVTVTAMDKPLLFARDRSERAANLRDYVTVTAVSVNRQGKRDCLLIAYIWSTLDARYEPARPVADTLELLADDRRIRLDTSGGTPEGYGIYRNVGAPPGRTTKPLVYSTDLDTLRYIAAARNLQVRATVGEETVSYMLWDDHRKALDALVRYLNGER